MNTFLPVAVGCIGAVIALVGEAGADESGKKRDPIPAQAADDPSFWDRDTLLGSWEGRRPRLREDGVDFELVYTGDGFTNVSGGADIGGTVQSLVALGLDLDLEPLLSWTGGTFHASGFWLEGRDLADEHVSALTAVTSIEGADEIRLFETWLEQSVLDGDASLRAGLLAADEEFMVSEIALLFINSTFGPPTGVTASAPLPIYPVAAPGARLRVDPARDVYVQVGVYDGDPGSETVNETGTRVRLDHEGGAVLLLEAGFRTPLEPRGIVKVGALYHGGEFEEFSTGRVRRGNGGVFAVLEQILYRETGDDEGPGLGAFLRFSIMPDEDRSQVPTYLDGGVTYRGLIPTRGEDVLGFGFAVMNVSGDFADTQASPSSFDREIVLEATYRVVLSPWLALQPDVQVIVHPEGTSGNDDAVVIGLRAEIVF